MNARVDEIEVPARPGLPPMPARIAARPRDARGYPVPYFVARIDGKPDFRVMDGRKLPAAVRHRLCWICGEPLGVRFAFVLGPMCAVNLTNAEPPSHCDCADWAARACPFLILPKAQRRDANLPDEAEAAPGISIRRNPGCVLVWHTRSYRVFADPLGGPLFRIGPPESLKWYAEGRTATRAEIMASIESGLPILLEMAQKDGRGAVAALQIAVENALRLVPADG